MGNSKASAASRKKRLDSGWVRIEGWLPPEANKAAQEMIARGEAKSMAEAIRIALDAFQLPQTQATA